PEQIDPLAMIRPRRKITGISAVLLPFTVDGGIDWGAFRNHLSRTLLDGMLPAVNMDTGYVSLIGPKKRNQSVSEAMNEVGNDFAMGVFVSDLPGDSFNLDSYRRELELAALCNATPVIFQSYGLTALSNDELLDAYRAISRECPKFIAFELGTQFAPFGTIYDLEVFAGLLDIPQCIAAKHSPLNSMLDCQRLQVLDTHQPSFHVFNGI